MFRRRACLCPLRLPVTSRSSFTRTCLTCGTPSTRARWRSAGSTRRSGRRTSPSSRCWIASKTRGSWPRSPSACRPRSRPCGPIRCSAPARAPTSSARAPSRRTTARAWPRATRCARRSSTTRRSWSARRPRSIGTAATSSAPSRTTTAAAGFTSSRRRRRTPSCRGSPLPRPGPARRSSSASAPSRR